MQKGEKLRDWSLESNYGKITGRVKEAMSWMKLKAATNWSTKSAGLRLIEIYPHQRQRESDFNKSLVFHSIVRFSHLWQHQTSFQQCWYIFLQLANFKLCQYLKTDNIFLDCNHRWMIRRNSSSTWLHVTFLFCTEKWKMGGQVEKNNLCSTYFCVS